MDGPGDMHVVGQMVMYGRRANVFSTVDDAQVSTLDQRLECLLEKGAQICVYRTHLQEHHAAFVE